MPFLWEQIVDLTYKPSFDVVRQEEAVNSLNLSFCFELLITLRMYTNMSFHKLVFL
jgi:hypothetical protein